MLDDHAYVLQAQGGDQEAIGHLYDRYITVIYRFIYYKVSDRDTAEDLTSTTFLKMVKYLHKFRLERDSFRSWLYTIARNTVIDFYRKQKPTIAIEDILHLESDDDSTAQTRHQLSKEEVKRLMKSLTQYEQDILTLRYWDDLSFKEIAEILGKSEGAVKVSCSRAISRLREYYPSLSLFLLHFFNQ